MWILANEEKIPFDKKKERSERKEMNDFIGHGS